MGKNLNNVYVVLIEPKNAGNIGASVRAMKNMGISHIRLIRPVDYRDVIEQKKMGYRSQEIIKESQEFDSLSNALADISLVFLATQKKGKWKKNFITPEKAADLISSRTLKEKIAIVFGREDSGVTIDESQLANYLIYIPSAVTYPSLNLSQAVLVILYEIYKISTDNKKIADFPKMATKQKFERVTNNIWSLMKRLEIREENNGLFHRSLKRAMGRTSWTNADLAVIDRACKQVRWYIENRTDEEKREVK